VLNHLNQSSILALVLCASLSVGSAGVRADAASATLAAAPTIDGPAGVVRTKSALIGDTGTTMLQAWSRGFFVRNFFLPGEDTSMFLEGGAAANVAFVKAVELSLQSRGATLTTRGLKLPASSLGDLSMHLKAGWSFGLFAAAAFGSATLATAREGFGYDVGATRFGGGLALTFDLTTMQIPLMVHVNGGYDSSAPALDTGGSPADSVYFDAGPAGQLIALTSQRWYWDRAHGSLAVEVPLPYVTPFVDVWYQASVLPLNYRLFGDAHLFLTPGVRVGSGGTSLQVAGDFAVSGSPYRVSEIVDGQPLAPRWAVRVALSHTFSLGESTVPARTSTEPTASTPTPTPTPAAAQAKSVPAQQAADVPVAPGNGRVHGYVTNKDDEALDAEVALAGGPSTKTNAGAYQLDAPQGAVRVIVSAPGYLRSGAAIYIADGGQMIDFVLAKEPKKRAVVLAKNHLQLTGRVPFEFKKPRLQSTATFLLDEVVDIMLANPELKIEVHAHTDALSSADEELTLTTARAQAVLNYLVAHGVDRARLVAVGKGASMPVSQNEPDKNRRVEFIIPSTATAPAAGATP
jgi:outer membrane protein OmpA-like peptidoglycan-associated protein